MRKRQFQHAVDKVHIHPLKSDETCDNAFRQYQPNENLMRKWYIDVYEVEIK